MFELLVIAYRRLNMGACVCVSACCTGISVPETIVTPTCSDFNTQNQRSRTELKRSVIITRPFVRLPGNESGTHSSSQRSAASIEQFSTWLYLFSAAFFTFRVQHIDWMKIQSICSRCSRIPLLDDGCNWAKHLIANVHPLYRFYWSISLYFILLLCIMANGIVFNLFAFVECSTSCSTTNLLTYYNLYTFRRAAWLFATFGTSFFE